MKLYIDYQDTINKARELENLARRLRRAADQLIGGTQSSLAASWTGDSAEAFRTKLSARQTKIRSRAERALPPPKTAFREIVQHEPYPVEAKAREILRKLKEHGITRFLLLFRGSRSRSEVVATFLAVLELCRAKVLHLAGSETDCTVRQEGEAPEHLSF